MPFWMVPASIPIGRQVARRRKRDGVRIKTLAARGGIDPAEWLAFENGVLSPREMLALERGAGEWHQPTNRRRGEAP